MFRQASEPERRREEGGRRVPRRPRVRHGAAALERRPLHVAGAADGRSRQGSELERLRRHGHEHAVRARGQGRPDRAARAAAEAEVGVRVSRRHLRARRSRRSSADACSSPARAARCSRSTRRPAAPTGRSTRSRASAAPCRSARTRAARRTAPYAIFFTDCDGQRVRRRRRQRQAALDAQGRGASHGARRPDRRRITTAASTCRWPASARRRRERARTTSAARSAAASPRSTPTPARWCGRRTRSRRSRRSAAVTKEGVQTWGPAGGGIWSAPTIDARRRVLYISTGNGYSDPPQPTTDAVIAMDLDTGKIKWVRAAGCAEMSG